MALALFLPLAVIAGLALIGILARAVRTQRRRSRHDRRHDRRQAAMRLRLRDQYPASEWEGDVHRLRSPPGPSGRVAVTADELLLDLGAEAGGLDLRRVPWARVTRAATARTGAIRVHVSGVGDVLVPSTLGREIWEAYAARAGMGGDGKGR